MVLQKAIVASWTLIRKWPLSFYGRIARKRRRKWLSKLRALKGKESESPLYSFARAALTKYHKPGISNNRNLSSWF
jgi:hypothetical protein